MAGATPGDPMHESTLSPQDHYGPAWEPIVGEEIPIYATFARRFAAVMVDGLIALYMTIFIGLALHMPGFETSTAASAAASTTQATNAGWDSIEFGIISVIYFLGSWLAWGGSPVQRFLKMRVCRDDRPVSLTAPAAAVRWVILFGVPSAIGALAVLMPDLIAITGFLQAAWVIVLAVTTYRDPHGQGLHDRYAHSVVVRD